jgi:hypothetical protein
MTAPAPEDGDVIVTHERIPIVHFTVRRHPDAAPVNAQRRDVALEVARGFAQVHAVNVWYCENGSERLLEVYRDDCRDAREQH